MMQSLLLHGYVLLYVILNDNISCMTNALKLRYHYKYDIDMSLSTRQTGQNFTSCKKL